MKTLNFLILAVIVLFFTATAQSQTDTSRAAQKEKLKKMVKEKLMEKMNLDDATATKLMELASANRKEMRELRKKEKELTDYIFDNPTAADVGTKIEDLLETENKINQTRNEHYAKLKTFLTPTQIAQSLVFQKELTKFMKKEMKLDKKESKERDGKEHESKDHDGKDKGPVNENRELF